MSLSIFLTFAIFSALSIATLGQSIPNTTECKAAIANIEQDSSCIGSAEGLAAFRRQFDPNTNLFSLSQLQQMQPGEVTYFSNFCTSQRCVNLLADVANYCTEVRI